MHTQSVYKPYAHVGGIVGFLMKNKKSDVLKIKKFFMDAAIFAV